ncbi:MAG: Hsp70 family protein [Deltaproteobacteria bacterium]|jgi:hypothetical protein|nr:Hsp70 family protein [Deltaproteobacteria bacterium]
MDDRSKDKLAGSKADVIGVDFGTTNTYLTICPYGTKNKFPLHLSGRSPAIDTAVLYADKAGEEEKALFPLIGERATATYGQADAETKERLGYRYYANFKPEIAGRKQARECAVDFFKAVKREAAEVGVLLNPGNDLIIIGAPSEASPSFRSTLQDLAVEAGLGQAEVVDEPKGVLLTDLGYNRFPLADILDGYLIVDFGGGTCDFALMRRGEVAASWGDMELGGRLFDDLFYQWFLEQNPEAEKELASQKREFYVWSYCCRRLKEDFSETVARDPKASVSAEVGRFGIVRNLTVDGFLQRAAHYSPSRAFVEFGSAVGSPGLERLKSGPVDLLQWFEDLLLEGAKGTKVRAVSLSGGSSKWFFVKETCARLLNLEGGAILGSPNPFGAISEGLAILPAVKMELETAKSRMTRDKDDFVKSRLMPEAEKNLSEFARGLAGRITSEFYDDKVVPILTEAVETGFKISETEKKILDVIDDYQPILAKLADTELSGRIGAVNAVLQSQIQAWLDAFGLRLEGRLPSDAKSLGLVEIDRLLVGEHLTKPLLRLVNGLVAAWTTVIAASLCGGSGLALLAAGPLGLIMGALGGIGLSQVGLKLGREKLEKMAREQNVPALLAKTVITEKNRRKTREDFSSDLIGKIESSYREALNDLPGELDKVIIREINQLGIINVF